MTGGELRETFLKYFERNGHARVRSSSLVPGDDPTLLFTNAGMVQFKSVFLGEERRDHVACAEVAAGRRCLGPECECDRWLEVWNLVFMQFNRDAGGTLTPLPRPSIDTGMGLERIAAVLQGKTWTYDTDLFVHVFEHIEKLARKRYAGSAEDDRVSMRVIADHARATAFLIADGVLPSNEWRGYVLRRIMRRAMRRARKLGITGSFFWRAIEGVVADMGDAYPELGSESDRIQRAVGEEEERFAAVLDAGMNRIAEYATGQGAGNGRAIDGRFLFTLYDTFGFPRDLAEDELRDRGWGATAETEASWESEMEAQRERARAGAAFAVGDGADGGAFFATVPQTFGAQKFLGYELLATPAKIWAMVREGDWARQREARQGQTVDVVLDQTP